MEPCLSWICRTAIYLIILCLSSLPQLQNKCTYDTFLRDRLSNIYIYYLFAFYSMCMCSPTCAYMFYLFLLWKDTRRGCCILWTVIADRCELPCWFWKPKLGPLQEQQVLSSAKPSLSPINNILKGHVYRRELYGNYYCFVMIIYNCCHGTHSILKCVSWPRKQSYS